MEEIRYVLNKFGEDRYTYPIVIALGSSWDPMKSNETRLPCNLRQDQAQMRTFSYACSLLFTWQTAVTPFNLLYPKTPCCTQTSRLCVIEQDFVWCDLKFRKRNNFLYPNSRRTTHHLGSLQLPVIPCWCGVRRISHPAPFLHFQWKRTHRQAIQRLFSCIHNALNIKCNWQHGWPNRTAPIG